MSFEGESAFCSRDTPAEKRKEEEGAGGSRKKPKEQVVCVRDELVCERDELGGEDS